MAGIDVDALLAELSADAPCGPDLEYDPDFSELERAAQGKPEQQIGNTIVEAEPPDYREVRRLALKLLSRTRDLRLGVQLARAAVRTDGHTGFRDALQLLCGLLQHHWDSVHPQLDPDDDLDPTLRVNTLLGLCDPEATLRGVREAPLVRSRVVGVFSYRDYLIATGELPPKGADQSPPELATIEAAFLDCEPESLQETADAVRQSLAAMQQMETLLTDRVGTTHAVDLSALPNELKKIDHLLSGWLARRGLTRAGSDGAATLTATAADVSAEAATNGSAAHAAAANGEIRTRDDVIRTLDRLCEYFEKHEPSSPLPLLLERAKRLVSKSFLEILRDLVPDAVAEAERLRGGNSTGSESESDSEQ